MRKTMIVLAYFVAVTSVVVAFPAVAVAMMAVDDAGGY